MTRMRTDVGGYGIPAIPTLPNSVYSVNSVGGKRFPQNARNAQKLLAEKSLPQMSTDAHRCRRVWHPCNTHADKFCEFCEFCGRKDIPTERTERTETSGREEPPTDEHGTHRTSGREKPPTDEHRCSQIRRVWHPCHTYAAKFCEFCAFCGRTAHPKYLCKSEIRGRKDIPTERTERTETSGREEPSTDEHGCAQM